MRHVFRMNKNTTHNMLLKILSKFILRNFTINVTNLVLTQTKFTCSNSTIETLEKVVKFVQTRQNFIIDVILMFLLLTLNIFHALF